ncbi:TPA: transketolase, partial [Streptococcus agalactiae]|nr:transketolase [Streptococcus agalactiae]
KQLDGLTADICNPGDFVAKFEAFGFDAVRVKGDDIEAIDKAIKTFQDSNSVRPKCIVLDSIKGQGVKELEELASNHHLRPDLQQKTMLERALISLRESLEVVE